MNISTAHKYIQELISSLPGIFSNVEVNFAFGHNRPLIGDWSDDENRGMLGGDNVGDKSGLYIYATDDNQIIYIGKATKNNLHHRVWHHVKTPKIMPDSWRTFPKTLFSNCPENPELVENVRNGKVRVYVFTVSVPEVISLIEVYLQIQHQIQHGKLPAFNKQIG